MTLRPKDVEHLCDALRRRTVETVLRFSGAFQDLNHAALNIGSLIHDNEHIYCLEMSGHVALDNDCARIICQNAKNLRSLVFGRSSIGGKEGDEIMHHLLMSASKLKKLIVMNSALNRVEGLCEGLKVNTMLTKLSLAGCKLEDGGKPLGDALRLNQCLRKLDLEAAMSGDEDLKYIVSALEFNSVLKELRLASNHCTNAIVPSIRKALLVNDTLTDFDISYNDLGSDGAACFAEILKQKTVLKELCLSETNIGVGGLGAIVKALCMNQSLQGINVGSNQLSDHCAPLIRNVLKTNATLKRLNIGFNMFSSDGFRIILDGVLHNRSLQRFSFTRCPFDSQNIAILCQILETTHTLSNMQFYSDLVDQNQLQLIQAAFRDNGSMVSVFGYESSFEEFCVRNRKMHRATLLSCLALLCLRRFRQSSLNVAPREIVQMFALKLWETRSDFVWL